MIFLALLLAFVSISNGEDCENVIFSHDAAIDPTQGNVITTIDLLDSMKFEMDITVRSFPTGWASVFRCGSTDHTRMPGIWLHPDSGRNGALHESFHISFSTANNWNPWRNPPTELVIGITYKLEIEIRQNSYEIFINGNSEHRDNNYPNHLLPTNQACYAGAPEYVPADVIIEDLKISDISGCDPDGENCDCFTDTTCTDTPWAVYKNGLYWAWASPCSGHCSDLPDPLPYGWRRATDEEWAAGYPSLVEFGNGAKCAAHIFDPLHNHCDVGDYSGGYVINRDNNHNYETLLVHDGCFEECECWLDTLCCKAKFAVERNDKYWAWASPCSGGCSDLPDPLPYGWRRATDAEWAAGYPSLADFDNGAKCAAHLFDPSHDHCDVGDFSGGYVINRDNNHNYETLLIHDSECDGSGRPIASAISQPGDELFDYPYSENWNAPSSDTTVTYTISTSTVYFVAGLLIFLLITNCICMYYTNCCKKQRKIAYHHVKGVDSEYNDNSEAEQMNI